MRFPRPASFRSLLAPAGWAVVCWVQFAWRLGYPSFWDPDEATYAETTREMLAAHSWLVPIYDGRPFFDKPPLFYLLQIASFSVFGATEFAARFVPAVSAAAILLIVAWFGRHLFDRDVGRNGALMFAVLPATFALSSYAILDMTFTALLFGGCTLLTVAALEERPRLQWPGYVLLALAILTKGPVALVLAGGAYAISLVLAPDARRALRRLNWGLGLLLITTVGGPWFLYMWLRFGDAFVTGYILRENLLLFVGSLYGSQRSVLFYAKVIVVGLLPWTPPLIGRLFDATRGLRIGTAERLLWSWSIAVVGFFTISGFKLDHYVFPAAPALCLLSAAAWSQARSEQQHPIGIVVGLVAIPLVLFAAGVVLIPGLDRVPLDLPAGARLLPIVLLATGLAMLGQIGRHWRPASAPYIAAGGLLACYAVVITIGLPAFEELKPTRRLARMVATTAAADDHIGTFRFNRWTSSWRFYVGRHSERLETDADLRRFFATPGASFLRNAAQRLRPSGDGGIPAAHCASGGGTFHNHGTSAAPWPRGTPRRVHCGYRAIRDNGSLIAWPSRISLRPSTA
jgi:4-amino-4-deoxy-L-arabinose transferase-like glycosyltransferase